MKAMDRVSRGKGFRGLLDYLLGRDGEAPMPGRLIGGNMAGKTPKILAAEYHAIANQRPDIERPVWHQALRLPVGETLSDERWNEIVREYLRILGLDPDKFQYTVWSHDDERAVHIAANRVAPNASVYLGQNENLKSTRATQSLERWFGLTITKGPEYDWSAPKPTVTPKPTPASRRKPRKGERQVIEQTGELSVRQQLQEILDAALLDRPSLHTFVQRLAAWNVRVIPNLASTGRMNGFSFSLDSVAMKASDLGSRYRWGELQKTLAFHAEHDRPLLERLHESSGQDVPTRAAPTVRCSTPAPSPFLWTAPAARTAIETLQKAILDTNGETHLLDYWEMEVGPEGRWLALTARNRRVIAYEDRVECGTGDDAEVTAMLVVARLKGWDKLTISGSPRFKLLAMTRALGEGFNVVVATDDDRKCLDRANRRCSAATSAPSKKATQVESRRTPLRQ